VRYALCGVVTQTATLHNVQALKAAHNSHMRTTQYSHTRGKRRWCMRTAAVYATLWAATDANFRRASTGALHIACSHMKCHYWLHSLSTRCSRTLLMWCRLQGLRMEVAYVELCIASHTCLEAFALTLAGGRRRVYPVACTWTRHIHHLPAPQSCTATVTAARCPISGRANDDLPPSRRRAHFMTSAAASLLLVSSALAMSLSCVLEPTTVSSRTTSSGTKM